MFDLNSVLTPPVIMCAGLAMMVVVVIRMRMRSKSMDAARAKSTSSAPSGTRDHQINLREVSEVARELNDLLAELQETSRRIAAQIDNRYAKLDAMLAEADTKIRRLEQLNGQDSQTTEAPAPSAPVGRSAPASMIDPKYKPIYELADKGKTPREIAQQLGAQPGEVELILNLRGPQRVAQPLPTQQVSE